MSDSMPQPGLAPAFTLELAFGADFVVGRLATGGVRTIAPVVGGAFAGGEIAGAVLGGSETRLARQDGVTVVEASYLIALAGGSGLRLVGTGYATRGGGVDGTRMTLAFEVDEAHPQAWLARRAFVGERRQGSPVLEIVQIV